MTTTVRCPECHESHSSLTELFEHEDDPGACGPFNRAELVARHVVGCLR